MLKGYKTIYKGGQGEIEEKKSRFIANIAAASTEEEAAAFIAEMKKKYWDARHNCSAFIIGKNAEITRCSDDGEPSGTAGKPMLEILKGEALTNVVVVVTRYFGGTLLGTGGLIRAYGQAVKAGLCDCQIMEKKAGSMLLIQIEYNDEGKLRYLLGEKGLQIMEPEYSDHVEMKTIVELEEKDAFIELLIKTLCARCKVSEISRPFYSVIGHEVLIFEE